CTTAPCGAICGSCPCATWSPSGSGSPALPTIRSTGEATSSFLKTARSGRLTKTVKASLLRPRQSQSRTKSQVIGKQQLAAPFCHLAHTVFPDVSGQAVVLRAFFGRVVFWGCVLRGQQKNRLPAFP